MMLALEEILSELSGEEVNEQGLPPGFRFHPTDEELITFYLASKVFNGTFCGVEIAEVDLNRCEPWELPDVAKMGEREWYFFSLRDRKYPTGLRTNRATGAGYWKATGKDREVCSASNGALLGMKKTLVFYKGRAPRGEKTKWVMHEYRLDGDFSYRHTCKEEWVICRIFHKAGEKKNGCFGQGQSYLFEAAAVSSPTGTSLPPLMDTQTALLECHSENPNHSIMETLQNPFVIHHQENDLKSLINHDNNKNNRVVSQSHLFPINGLLQASFSPTTTTNTGNATNKHIVINTSDNNPSPSPSTTTATTTSPSMLFKSLLSHQDFALKEQATSSSSTTTSVPKHCKTEANFSHFQLPDSTNFSWMDKIHPNPYQNPLLFEMDNCSFPGLSQGFTTAAAAAMTSTSVNDMSTSLAFNRAGFQVMFDHHPIRESWPLDA